MKTRISLLTFYLCFIFIPVFSQNTEDYIQRYKGIAETEMLRTGVPAAIALAQGIVESASGSGWLAQNANNYFGIKCKNNWIGETISYDDDQRNECFRKYTDPDASWRDHSDFLRNTPRYAFLFDLDPTDYKAWAYGLKKAGYATLRTYPERLVDVIERYHLQQYTQVALAMKHGKVNEDFANMLDQKIRGDMQSRGITEVHPMPAPTQPISSASYPAGVFQINGLRVVYLQAGTSLISVAAQNHLKLRRLLRFNEINQEILRQDQLIYLQKKRKSGTHVTHQVLSGETMTDIARKEGIQLKWLYKRNSVDKNHDPIPGRLVRLQDYAFPQESTAGQGTTAVSVSSGSWLKRLFSKKKQSPPTPSVSALPRESSSGPTSSPSTPKALYSGITPVTPKSSSPQISDSGATPAQSPILSPSGDQLTYLVKKGDTLYSIAKQFDTTVEQIRQWNHLQDNQIRTGQSLMVRK